MRRRYRVVGKAPVFDHAPGETFEANLSAALEARLIAAGHLQPVATRASTRRPRMPAGAQIPRTRGGDTKGGARP